ncbi:MAG: nucleotidyltransferase [Chloroflexi bacterium]|nr:nucleotidyltransferase [Chloroflexota bacterium]
MRWDEALAILAAHRDELREMGVGSLSLIGDIVQAEVGSESRIEILIVLSKRMGYFTFLAIERRLAEMLGQPVFLLTPEELPENMRSQILGEAIHAA